MSATSARAKESRAARLRTARMGLGGSLIAGRGRFSTITCGKLADAEHARRNRRTCGSDALKETAGRDQFIDGVRLTGHRQEEALGLVTAELGEELGAGRVSTPSATTSRPNAWERPMMALTIASSASRKVSPVDEGPVDLRRSRGGNWPQVGQTTRTLSQSHEATEKPASRRSPQTRQRRVGSLHEDTLGDLDLHAVEPGGRSWAARRRRTRRKAGSDTRRAVTWRATAGKVGLGQTFAPPVASSRDRLGEGPSDRWWTRTGLLGTVRNASGSSLQPGSQPAPAPRHSRRGRRGGRRSAGTGGAGAPPRWLAGASGSVPNRRTAGVRRSSSNTSARSLPRCFAR